MVKKDNKNIVWIIGFVVLLLIVLNKSGINIKNTSYPNTQTEYWCCNSNGVYSCNSECSFGSSKVYTGSFNTLSSCNSKCVTPNVFEPPQQQPDNPTLTCQQIAEGMGASYKNTPVSSAQECHDFAVLDCQDTGKIIDGYGVQGSCCYFICTAAAPVVTCTDSDGGQDDQQFIKGTVTDGSQSYTDQCDWNLGGVTEYYCDGSTMKFTNFQCENYWTCQEGKCAQQLCEDIMNPTFEKCAAGYTTDGGVCQYWALNGGVCLSSFN